MIVFSWKCNKPLKIFTRVYREIYREKKEEWGIRTGNLRLTWYWSGCAETHEMYPPWKVPIFYTTTTTTITTTTSTTKRKRTIWRRASLLLHICLYINPVWLCAKQANANYHPIRAKMLQQTSLIYFIFERNESKKKNGKKRSSRNGKPQTK